MQASFIPIFTKTRFEYSYLGTPAPNTEQVVMAPAIDLIQFKFLQLFVRVHRITISTGQSFAFTLYSTLPSDEDPQEFTDTSAGGTIITLSIPTGTTAPSLLNSTSTTPPAFGKLVFTATQGSTPGTALYAELSACLMGRPQ